MGLKWPRYDIGHLPPSSAKFKNEWIYISIHLYALMVWTGTTLLSMEIVNIVCKSDKNIYLNRQEVKSVHSVQQYYLLGLFTVD